MIQVKVSIQSPWFQTCEMKGSKWRRSSLYLRRSMGDPASLHGPPKHHGAHCWHQTIASGMPHLARHTGKQDAIAELPRRQHSLHFICTKPRYLRCCISHLISSPHSWIKNDRRFAESDSRSTDSACSFWFWASDSQRNSFCRVSCPIIFVPAGALQKTHAKRYAANNIQSLMCVWSSNVVSISCLWGKDL